MKIRLDYGRKELEVEIPDRNLYALLKMNPVEPLANPRQEILRALKNPIGTPPLSQIADGKEDACIVISDITRPVPNKVILPVLIRELISCGMNRENITILVGTGLHRPNEGQELVELVGEEISSSFRIVNHLARNEDEQEYLGQTSTGVPMYADRAFVKAALKIVTGLIEPHLMAGFSGGAKGICPGVAGEKSIRAFHGPHMLEDPFSHEGIIEGNIVHKTSVEFAKKTGVDFMINVTLNAERYITGVFAGDIVQAHYAGIEQARSIATACVEEEVDIVLTTAGGFPLDLTFYQTIKGITAAVPIVKKGGTIIVASKCAEGIGQSEYTELIRSVKNLDEFMHHILETDFFCIDQWQLQQLAHARRRANVILVSDGIDKDVQKELFVQPAPSVEAAVAQCLNRYGNDVKIAVIAKGPYVLPVVKKKK